jgi:hypothetical protein
MIQSGDIAKFMNVELPALCQEDTHDEAGYALPDASRALLLACVSQLGIRRVFEFGSGRSTRDFLRAGCRVTVVEDSQTWLDETMNLLDADESARLVSHVLPLHRVWMAGAPLRSWNLSEEALQALGEAELVLVDSPAWPPFREHALALALGHCRAALIVVDDANIPTVSRFCRRLAGRGRAPFFQTAMDHGLFFTGSLESGSVDIRRPVLETLKAWRRYFLAGRIA